MRRLKVVIIDDEPLARDLLRRLLLESGQAEIVGEGADGLDLAALATRTSFDLAFCDVNMPGVDGLTAIRRLRTTGRPSPIFVLTTAFAEHALPAFEIGVLDYLLKPIGRDNLQRSLDRAVERLSPTTGKKAYGSDLWVSGRKGQVRVSLSTVLRVEAAGDHVYLHQATGTHLYRGTMKGLADDLEAAGLVRVSRSHFVRQSAIESVRRFGRTFELVLHGAVSVSVGPNYADRVKRMMRREA